MTEQRALDGGMEVSARIERAERSVIGRPGTLRERAKPLRDILVEDLSRTGCRMRSDVEIPAGTRISIGIPGAGMQAARVMRSKGEVHGCAFLLELTDQEVENAMWVNTVPEAAFSALSGRIRSAAAAERDQRSAAGKASLFSRLVRQVRGRITQPSAAPGPAPALSIPSP